MSRALAYPVNNKASMLFSIELLGCMDLKFLHYAQMTAVSYTIFVRRILGTGGPGASAQVFSDLGGSSLAEKQPMSFAGSKMIGYRNAL